MLTHVQMLIVYLLEKDGLLWFWLHNKTVQEVSTAFFSVSKIIACATPAQAELPVY